MNTVRKQYSLQDFNLLQTIGTGTFGRVYLVQLSSQVSSPPFALKVMSKGHILNLNQLRHIRSEHHLLRTLSHPGIVSLIQTFQDKQNLYMVFDYVQGGELFSQIHGHGVSEDSARFYTCEILLVLEYLHERHIAHRDLKPENILLDNSGHVKISDFGFAKTIENRAITSCGTPEYMAPEILLKTGHNTTVDWWALGILLYEMIVGTSPFEGESAYDVYTNILRGKIAFPKQFPSAAKSLVKKLLIHEPEKRLGARKDSIEVKSHKFFKGVNWESYEKRTARAPWVPPVRSRIDTSCFCSYSETEDQHVIDVPEDMDDLFRDF